MSDPFEGRKKAYTGETLEAVKAKIVAHRKEAHSTEDDKLFFDCAACGVLERRLASLSYLAGKDKKDHPKGCDCWKCWEPVPAPGQTMEDACAQELEKELRLMDQKYLDLMLGMVAREHQRRNPLTGMTTFTQREMGRANVKQTKALIKILCDAFNARMADESLPEVDFIDSFMALVNFCRLVLETIEEQAKLDTLPQKRGFRTLFVTTISESLMKRVTN